MIYRESKKSTTGDEDSVVQSFTHNIYYDSSESIISPFIFEVPQYSTVGGTTDYYGQNPLAIFTSLVKPFIRYDFSENTDSFGPDTFIKHDIYRISWDMYSTIQDGLKTESDETIQSENDIVETIEEVDEVTGEVKIKTIRRNISELKNTINSSRKTDSKTANRNAGKVTNPTIADLQSQLLIPVISITAATTGITTNIYDFQPEQYIKNLGEHKQELYQDRDQYIVDTNFIFNRTSTTGLKDVKSINDAGRVVDGDAYKSVTVTETTTDRQNIDRGEFAGLNFAAGEYFSYFEVPDKPIIEYPSPDGQIDTFTPEIFWSNGEGADEYLVQITYNTGDTGFTGTIFSYPIPKSDDFKEEAVSKTKSPDTEFTASKTIRKFQTSLKTGQCLLYRVGNVKVLKNIYDVRQSVVTFSEYKSICTQTNPINTFVFTESDSPYSIDIAGLVTPPSLDSESILADYVLSGTVTGSTIDGASMTLIYPNASFITQSTDASGGFVFTSLEAGTYTLNTTYRGYVADSRQVVVSSDTNLDFYIEIAWDNDYDIWAVKENDIIKY